MNPQSISIGANTYSLVPMPTNPAPRALALTMTDSVATVTSAFTQQQQAQSWPGADLWRAQVTLPPLSRSQAATWRAWMMQLRGASGVFQLGDITGAIPLGSPMGAPVVDGSLPSNNAAMSTVLSTKGWTPNSFRLLLPGDYLQIGYRLYTCLDSIASDLDGNAAINLWPSLREQPADGAAIVLHNTTGLFRLAANDRQVSADVEQLYGISFKAVEVR